MSRSDRHRTLLKIAGALCIGTLSTGLGYGLLKLPLGVSWEGGTFNERAAHLMHRSEEQNKIRLVYLDQGSLDWGEDENAWRWPWFRELYGAMTTYFTMAGAASVTFDVIYSEESVHGAEDDEAFGLALQKHGNTTAAMLVSEAPRKSMQRTWPTDIPVPTGISTSGGSWKTAMSASFPILAVATNATRLGTVNNQPDHDGTFRSLPVATRFDGKLIPSLGVATYLLSHPTLPPDLPVRSDGSVILRFADPTSYHPPFSAGAILQSLFQINEGKPPAVDPSEFKDCHVFFGFSAEGLKDLRPTPIDPAAPGVILHATMLENLLSGRFIREISPTTWIPIYSLLATLCAAWALFNHTWRGHIPPLLLALAAPWVIGYTAYAFDGWWPIIPGLAASLSATTIGVLINYATEGRQKAFIKQAFSRYLSPIVIDQLVQDPEQLQLGGEKKELSIFFSDLAGFSSFSERLNPTQLTTFLNEYLTAMTDIILEEEGTLDKYEGDAIIAFWNAPLTLHDHAIRAVRTALRCQERLTEMQSRFMELGGVELRMRIGIHTGEVVVGNFGSRDRFNYTVLGDAANLASRLEGANKALGTLLMISESTWDQLSGRFPGRFLARLRVVGRKQIVPVYEPFWGTPPPPEVLLHYQNGLEALEHGKLKEALSCFEANPTDPPSVKYAEAIRGWMQDASSFDNGIWNLTNK